MPAAGDDPLPATFQAVLAAFKKPGAAVHLAGAGEPPQPLNAASAALLAAWVNPDTPVWTDLAWGSDPADWLLRTVGGSLVTEASMARVAVIADPGRIPPLNRFFGGEDDRPEKSANLIVQVRALPERPRGPAVGGRCREACPTGLPLRFWRDWQDQARGLPFGIDLFLTCRDWMVALPRGLQMASYIVS
jgi:alpha-D-ribose 1-methylphosphonate 5-triphosphate synthase subunit PhnH